MRIAVFDYLVVPTNPVGSCHLRMLRGLCREHEFVVFASRFDNPCPQRIRFVRVPVPRRPLSLMFVVFHVMAPLCYLWYRLRGGASFDIIQTVETGCLFRSDIIYCHFCHRRFLREHWPQTKARGLRNWLRGIEHWLYGLPEPWVYRRATCVVVPSTGLARELVDEYPTIESKIVVVSNPVDVHEMRRPQRFDREALRGQFGATTSDTVLVFVALGHYERKGLPLVLQAMQSLPGSVRLWVVGGRQLLVSEYRKTVAKMGLQGRVHFAGMQTDVRPFLWSADAFILPSFYETFSLVSFEAAAAGIPVLVSHLNGVEDFLIDGENGILLKRTVEGVREGIRRLLQLSAEQREEMVRRAQRDIANYSIERFHSRWRDVYDQWASVRKTRSGARKTDDSVSASLRQAEHVRQ